MLEFRNQFFTYKFEFGGGDEVNIKDGENGEDYRMKAVRLELSLMTTKGELIKKTWTDVSFIRLRLVKK
jgi:hypothetical protein